MVSTEVIQSNMNISDYQESVCVCVRARVKRTLEVWNLIQKLLQENIKGSMFQRCMSTLKYTSLRLNQATLK